MTHLLAFARRHVVGVAVAFLAFAGTAYGVTDQFAGTAKTKQLRACAPRGGGALHTANARGKCATGERKLVWNAQGPRGLTGATGAAGPKGDPGAKGDTGPAGPKGDTGVTNFTTGEKDLPLTSPTNTPIFTVPLSPGAGAGGTIAFTIVAANASNTTVVAHGTVQWLMTANLVTCSLAPDDSLSSGVTPTCSVGFFAPGNQPGISINDTIALTPLVSHKVYYTIEDDSANPINLR